MAGIQATLPLGASDAPARSISTLLELGGYEVLWSREGAAFRSIADLFRDHPDALPSDLVPGDEAREMARRVLALLEEKGVSHFGVRVHRAGEYPQKLRDARHPVELLYYFGVWNWVEKPSVVMGGLSVPTGRNKWPIAPAFMDPSSTAAPLRTRSCGRSNRESVSWLSR